MYFNILIHFLILLIICFIQESKSTQSKMTIRHNKQNSTCNRKVCPEDITRALDTFLENYDPRIRPGLEEGPTKVYSYYYVTGFGPASEQDMEYTLDMFFRQKWRDDRLSFAHINSDIQELQLNNNMVQRLWTPDSFFRNGKKSIAHNITVPNRLLRIYPDGNILYTIRLTIKAQCPMILIDFPMDVHTCDLVYGSYGYTSDELQFIWYEENGTQPVDVPATSSRLNQFELINYTWSSDVIHTVSGDYTVLQTKFHLKRQMGYFVIQTYLPCILIVILSQISFWINKEAVPARTVSGIMTVLNLTTLSISTRQSLPKVAYATALDWYMSVCFAFCFAALIEFASVNYFQRKVEESRGMRKKKKSEKKEKLNLESSMFHSCSVLSKRVLEIRQGEGTRKVNLSDLFKMAAGIQPFEDKQGFPKFMRSLGETFLPKSWFQTQQRPIKGGVSKNDMILARKLLAAVEMEIKDVAKSQGGVSRIDQVSRVAFPLAFFFFNGIYWFVYLSHQSHEVAYRLRS